MNRAKTNGRIGQEARMVMHQDEHAIIKSILLRALGDDECFATIVAGERSESERAEDRLVLARFLARMERQFDLRAEERLDGGTEREVAGHPYASRG